MKLSLASIWAAVWKFGTPSDRVVTISGGANVTQWNGSAVAAPATAGVPKVAIEAAGDFAQGAADKAWSSAMRTLTAFGFSVTVGTNNDKGGYSLTAGSYSVRASSSQRATAALGAGVTSASISISSVTTSRATATGAGTGQSGNTSQVHGGQVYLQITAGTTVTATRGSGTDTGGNNTTATGATEVFELF